MDNIIFKKETIELYFDIDSEIDLRREIDYYFDENNKIIRDFDNENGMWVLDDYTIENVIIYVEKGRYEVYNVFEIELKMKYVSSCQILTSIPI